MGTFFEEMISALSDIPLALSQASAPFLFGEGVVIMYLLVILQSGWLSLDGSSLD